MALYTWCSDDGLNPTPAGSLENDPGASKNNDCSDILASSPAGRGRYFRVRSIAGQSEANHGLPEHG
jgi:hypothetical protein